eukprot:COSAG02_NODE_6042_length_3848_cov_3.936783_2_plen_736_part_00
MEAWAAEQQTPFGQALSALLEDAPPIVASSLHLEAWLHLLAEETSADEAARAAQLYLWLRCGFAILPADAQMRPQWRRNYSSALDAASDVTAELQRLLRKGHLLHWAEAQRRFKSCRALQRPTVVLAMGLITKITDDGSTKLRVVLDASGEDRNGVSLNNQINMEEFKTVLPTVQKYADALAILGPESKLFKADLTDSYFSFPLNDDSVPLVGIYGMGKFFVYHSLVFGVSSAVYAFQLLSVAVSRGCIRRWRAAGISCFHPPSLVDLSQPTPRDFSATQPETPPPTPVVTEQPDVRFAAASRPAAEHDTSVLAAVQRSLAGQADLSAVTTRSPHTSPRPLRAAYMSPYIDDFAGLAVGPEPDAVSHLSAIGLFPGGVAPQPTTSAADFCYRSLRHMLDWLGLPANTKPGKCVPPCTEGDILGIGFNTSRMILFITTSRAQRLQRLLHQLIASSRVTVMQLQSSMGILNFISVVLPAGKPYLSATINALKRLGKQPSSFMVISTTDDMRSHWTMWLRILSAIGTRPVSLGVYLPTIRAAAFSDASFEGGGYFWGGIYKQWTWPSHWTQYFGESGGWRITINTLEAIALLILCRDILPLCGPGKVLHIYLDNTAVKYSLRKQRSKSNPINRIFMEITMLLCYWGTVTKSHFVDSKSNECADVLSRASSISEAAVIDVISRWSAAHPDCTNWRRQPPDRPSLARLLRLHRWSYNDLTSSLQDQTERRGAADGPPACH